ncbi:MAG: class I SAM-dependent methyltransferase [Ignavibacteriales bacterium]|nr:class I SAM-dependent methyltransferase [Ignavibacteriales bacterium]
MEQVIRSYKTSEVAEAFDAVSAIFDTSFENEITRTLRAKIYYEVERLVPQGASIMDINCGTGIDAIHFATKGFHVTGIDISAKMLEEAKKKVGANQVRLCKFYQGSFDAIPPEIDEKFDLLFSNFGGLNCSNNLEMITKEIARVVKPSGFFVGVIMPPFSLWETLSYLLRGNLRLAVRRLNSQTKATGFLDKTFTVYYHSTEKIISSFSPYFQIRQIIGLNMISPPPHALGFAKRFPKLSKFLSRFDALIETLPALRAMGDHYIVIAQKR